MYLFMGLKHSPSMSLALSSSQDCFVSLAPRRRPSYLPGKGPSVFHLSNNTLTSTCPYWPDPHSVYMSVRWQDHSDPRSPVLHLRNTQGRIHSLGSKRAVGDGGSWVNVYCLTETRPCQGHQCLTQVQGTGKAFPWPMCRLLATHEENVHFTFFLLGYNC